MRILMLNYEFPPLGGGAGNANFFILKEFAKNNNLFIDLVTSSDSTFRTEKISDQITIHYLNIGKQGNLLYQSNKELLRYTFQAYYYCKNMLKNKSFDFVHAFFGIPCGYIAYKLHLPYIISLRGSDVPGHNPAYNLIHTLIYRINKNTWGNARKIIANSEDLKRTALQTNFTRSIDVISNGIDSNFFRPLVINKNSSLLNILFVGRLNKIKNIDILVKTVAELNGVVLNIAGDGPEKGKLETLARSLGVTEKVNFLNRNTHDKLLEIYNQNDLFVLPSTGEGGSNVVLEAMACGLPVIISNTGGAETMIQENGFILNELSVESLKEKISYFQNNKEALKQMGLASRKIAEQLSWEKTAQQYLNIYQNVYSGIGIKSL